MKDDLTFKNILCSELKEMVKGKVKGVANIKYLIKRMCCLLVFPFLFFNHGKLQLLLSESVTLGRL